MSSTKMMETAKIGNLRLKSRLVLAPMTGINDIAFRIMCKRYGAGLVYTGMVNANAIAKGNKSTLRMMQICDEERPVAIQIFGANEDYIFRAAKIVEESGADMIDFNLGCPDKKVLNQGAGAALLKRPTKISSIIKGLVKIVGVPVTAKIRLGISSNNGLKTAKIIEEAGASAIAVHGRTVKQGYSGHADWDVIKEIKESLGIPVMGNGDIFSADDAQKMLEQTRCDFAMIGRGSIGNPQVFNNLKDASKMDLLSEYMLLAKEYRIADIIVKRQVTDFTKGLPGSKKLRQRLMGLKNIKDIENLVKTNYRLL